MTAADVPGTPYVKPPVAANMSSTLASAGLRVVGLMFFRGGRWWVLELSSGLETEDFGLGAKRKKEREMEV